MAKRSKTINFPRYSLKQCENWLKEIDSAKKLSKSKLSKLQGFSTDASMSAGSARAAMLMFGLMNYNQGEYELSDLGRILRSPVSDAQCLVLRTLIVLYPEKFREIYNLTVKKT